MVSHSTDFQNAVWVCNPSVLPQLGTLSFTVGASTAASVLLTQSNGELMLMGRPVAFNHKCPILGQVGDIALCSFGSYVVGLRQGVAVESSPHPGFTSNAATFRALVRIDGQPIISTPYVGADGRSYSPFVALALR